MTSAVDQGKLLWYNQTFSEKFIDTATAHIDSLLWHLIMNWTIVKPFQENYMTMIQLHRARIW